MNIKRRKTSIYDKWINLTPIIALALLLAPIKASAVPGASCDPNAPSACDVCNLESCVNVLDPVAVDFRCVNGNGSADPAATPTPACPLVAEAPGCWTTCTEIPIGDGFEQAECAPTDSFCNGISGGTESNQCRVGVCLDNPDFDPLNPSGCDYTLEPDNSTECRNCIPEGLATLENCGNGICEPDEGEGCETCSIDCRTPGYDGECLVVPADQQQLDAICVDPAGIVFPGPPYPNSNQFPGQVCEDGNLCTTNVCNTSGTCDVTELGCEPDADFCCPSGCSAPTSGDCRDDAGAAIPGCDPDCYVPEQCVPTPSPTPPPVFAGCLQGSGGWGEKGGPGCGGFACSLNTRLNVPSHGLALSLMSALALAGFLSLRKRQG